MIEMLLWLISLIVGGESEVTAIETHLRMDAIVTVVEEEANKRGLGEEFSASCPLPLGYSSPSHAEGTSVLRLQAGSPVVVQCSLYGGFGGFDSSIKLPPAFYANVGISLADDGSVVAVVGFSPVAVEVPEVFLPYVPKLQVESYE